MTKPWASAPYWIFRSSGQASQKLDVGIIYPLKGYIFSSFPTIFRPQRGGGKRSLWGLCLKSVCCLCMTYYVRTVIKPRLMAHLNEMLIFISIDFDIVYSTLGSLYFYTCAHLVQYSVWLNCASPVLQNLFFFCR